MLEKAQKPNGVWQPLRRCRQVLERLAKDSFASIFLEPVNLEDFPDYEEVIDVMMDLGTVRQRLETRKYQAPEQFARDLRRVRTLSRYCNRELSKKNCFGAYEFCFVLLNRFGTIARSTTSTGQPSGTLLITCRSSLNVSIMHGSWNSGSVICDGPIQERGHGSTRAVSTMASAERRTTKWSSVTIVMACTAFSVLRLI